MSNIAVLEQNIYGVEAAFLQVAVDPTINFKKEAEFAMQVIGNNDYSLGIATKNPQSVRDAVTNIAAIGISLNPAKKQAYLVPRDGKICLDISYMGLIDLATASGSIDFAKAELVRATDAFALNGFDKPPTHQFDPFAEDRGAIIGVYSVAKLHTGDYLTDTMTIAEVYEIRNRGSAWKSGKSNPWKTDEGEMIKKTILKRAAKTWPRSDRLDHAIHHLNTDGGEGIELASNVNTPVASVITFNPQAALQKINEVATLQDLEKEWKLAAGGCRATDDKVAYARLKAAVLERSSYLKSMSISEEVAA